MKGRWGVIMLIAVLIFGGWAATAGDIRPLTGRILRFEDFQPTRIPTGLAMADTLAYLEYPEVTAEVRALPVAGADAGSRLLLVAPNSELLCGTGGCPYVAVDAHTGKKLGDFFGSLVVLDRLVDGFPVLQVLSRRDFDHTGLSTYVHASGSYVLVSRSLLDGVAMDDWRRALTAVNSEAEKSGWPADTKPLQK